MFNDDSGQSIPVGSTQPTIIIFLDWKRSSGWWVSDMYFINLQTSIDEPEEVLLKQFGWWPLKLRLHRTLKVAVYAFLRYSLICNNETNEMIFFSQLCPIWEKLIINLLGSLWTSSLQTLLYNIYSISKCMSRINNNTWSNNWTHLTFVHMLCTMCNNFLQMLSKLPWLDLG